MELKEAGFDCKSTSPPDSSLKQFVYWEPGSCITLSSVTLQICSMCIICMDYQPVGHGFSCSKKHFQCWECFAEFVKQASEPDSVGKTINEKGNLLCPDTKCNNEITLHDVAKENVPEKIFESLKQLTTDFKIKKAVEKALKESEARRIKEQARLAAIRDKEERKAEEVRLYLIENVLTLRCPRCKTAFIDYTGCAALTCSNCRVGFCAICLQDCGTDAHAHVPNCPENFSRGIYISQGVFDEHHRKRREKIINDMLKELPKKARDILIQRITKELDDLGIKIEVATRNDNNVPEPAGKKSLIQKFFEKF